MAPNLIEIGMGLPAAGEVTTRLRPTTGESVMPPKIVSKSESSEHKLQLVWPSIIFFTYWHIAALYGAYLIITEAKLASLLWVLFGIWCGSMSITAGAHRLWAHKCYKAKLPLRILLAFLNCTLFEYSIYTWVRDHRVHHKFTDSNADPYNSKRGFFFSHMGWLLTRKHQDVKIKGKTIDMSDLEKDPVVVWQNRLYYILMPLCTFVIPTWIPCYCWGERGWTSWNLTCLRYIYCLHVTWLVNSVAHMWGTKPYDKFITPVENIYVGILAYGEGWHNYHHAFPWDYKTSEFSGYTKNVTTAFIDFFAWLGWAYDLKTANPDMIAKRIKRTGDGSHPTAQAFETKKISHDVHHHANEDRWFWGWGDEDMTEEDKSLVTIINPAGSIN